MAKGLILLVGVEGSGRRAFIDYARRCGVGAGKLIFPRRYVAGPLSADEEDHVALSPAMFDDWRDRHFFAFHWHDNCCRYAIGKEIDIWLDAGLIPVVAIGMEAVAMAAERYNDARFIHVARTGHHDDQILEHHLKRLTRERGLLYRRVQACDDAEAAPVLNLLLEQPDHPHLSVA